MGKLHRETTKIIKIGSVKIGGGNPVLIQSMTNTAFLIQKAAPNTRCGFWTQGLTCRGRTSC